MYQWKEFFFNRIYICKNFRKYVHLIWFMYACSNSFVGVSWAGLGILSINQYSHSVKEREIDSHMIVYDSPSLPTVLLSNLLTNKHLIQKCTNCKFTYDH